jgi:hypothetical protein
MLPRHARKIAAHCCIRTARRVDAERARIGRQRANSIVQTEGGQRTERIADQRVATNLVARKRPLVGKNDAESRLRQGPRDGTASGTGADDEGVATAGASLLSLLGFAGERSRHGLLS